MKKLFYTSIIAISFLLILSSLSFAAEEIVITTYYPSPYGSYQELRVQRMAIGSTYYDRSLFCWRTLDSSCSSSATDPGSNTSLIVQGSVGIGSPQPYLSNSRDDKLYVYTATSGQSAIQGDSLYDFGVIGTTHSYGSAGSDTCAVYGENYGSGVGTYGYSGRGRGMVASGATGISVCNGDYSNTYCMDQPGTAVYAWGNNYGVYSISNSGFGVVGSTSSTNPDHSGVFGWNYNGGVGTYGGSQNGRGVVGDGPDGGVVGYSVIGGDPPSGTGVAGYGSSYGVWATTVNGFGVVGYTSTSNADISAVFGWNYGSGVGTYGGSQNGRGLVGDGPDGGVVGYGGAGGDPPSGTGVAGYGSSYGVWAQGGTYAGYFNGKVYIKGTLTIEGGSIVGADVAEDIICPDCAPSEVVVIDPQKNNQYKKSSQPYDSSVAGIISNKPSMNLNIKEGEKSAKPLALVGVVKCKVTTENGSIKSGDLLVTSSKPGYAMRADLDKIKPGMLIGKALEPLEKDEGETLVLIK